ncbi:MAG: hypothetical protein AAFQ07_12730, partial [Chloroflexota bacterium]
KHSNAPTKRLIEQGTKMATRKYETEKDVQFLGVALLTIAENPHVTNLSDLIREYGYNNIDPDRWYSLQDELNFMKALSARWQHSQNMVAIGMNIFDKLVIPDDIRTVKDGINMLNAIVHLNCRNYRSEWEYIITHTGKNSLHVTDNTPWPHDLVYGYLYGLCKKLLPPSSALKLRRKYMNINDPDASGAHYDITWD